MKLTKFSLFNKISFDLMPKQIYICPNLIEYLEVFIEHEVKQNIRFPTEKKFPIIRDFNFSNPDVIICMFLKCL